MAKINALLTQADLSISSGNIFLAEKLLKEALLDEPENPWSHLMLARLFLSKKNIEEAKKSVFTALRFDPDNVYAFFLLAKIDFDSHDYAGADGWISKALSIDPGYAEYLGFKSLIQLFGFANITEARKLSSEGLKANPDNVTCLVAYYYVESKANNQDAANKYIRAAIQKHPDDPDLHALLSVILFQEGNREGAYHSIMAALKQIPNSESYQQRLKEMLSSENVIVSTGRKLLMSGAFQKVLKLLAILAGIAWIASLYGHFAQDKKVLIPVFIIYNLLLIVLSLSRILKPIGEVHIFIFKKRNFTGSFGSFSISLLTILLGATGLLLFVVGIFQTNEMRTELFISIAAMLFVLTLVLNMLTEDYRSGMAAKYISHGWICIVITLIVLLINFSFSDAGFEIVSLFLFFALLIFYGIRNRWEFDNKYDMSKTLTAHE